MSIGYNEHDFLLALGVIPVALRDWYGEQPNSVWPWAQDELGGATPEVLPATDLNFEQIAALEPDLIVGVWSGMTAEDYELLRAIAPTVAQPETYDDYGTPWQEQTRILGAATGRTAEAEAVVADVEGQIVAARKAHPEWEGQTSSVAFVTEEGPGAYASQDTRSRFVQDLGFEIPEINDSDDENSFYLQLSAEDITALDVGVLVWVIGAPEALEGILNQLPDAPVARGVRGGSRGLRRHRTERRLLPFEPAEPRVRARAPGARDRGRCRWRPGDTRSIGRRRRSRGGRLVIARRAIAPTCQRRLSTVRFARLVHTAGISHGRACSRP